ncbi:hypothetical protein [Rossellomorea aquimaris]|uniref:hypothetical protein n=1 Tax=Rossellomorea aquimaris TaxID=189382 RepID=UPI001CFDD011|nr:hypothetical protein [Rossellomorea aquimaris]
MTAKSMLICPTNIVTYYHDEIRNEERAKKIVQAERDRKSRIIPLVAEEVTKGEYVLIENFEYYSALLKTQPNVRVPCLVYPGTSNEKRLTHILKICIPLEKGTSWLFKNELVMKLKQDHHLSDSTIARKVNCNTSTINRYTLDTRIPQHIREKALKMEAKTVLEKIASSIVIPEEVKMILYKKAIIEKGNDFRLTGKKFEYMKEFCSVCILPDALLGNTPGLEIFLDSLIFSNFKIKEHMRSLYNSFSIQETTLDQEDISIH